MRFTETTVTVANNGTESAHFLLEPWALFFGALFPAMDDGNIGLEISRDGGSNYFPVLDPADGRDVVLCASGSDPGWVDFSDFVKFVIPTDTESRFRVRFTCATQSSGAVDIVVIQKG